jgi:hypothetical protein
VADELLGMPERDMQVTFLPKIYTKFSVFGVRFGKLYLTYSTKLRSWEFFGGSIDS